MDWEVGTDMYTLVRIYWEFPGGWMDHMSVKESQKTGVQSLGQEDPLEE